MLVYTTCESTTQDRGGAPGLFGTYEECMSKGVSYVALGISVAVIYMWGFLFEWLRPPPAVLERDGGGPAPGKDAERAVRQPPPSDARIELITVADPEAEDEDARARADLVRPAAGPSSIGSEDTEEDGEELGLLLNDDRPSLGVPEEVVAAVPAALVSRLWARYVGPAVPVLRKAATPPVIASLLGIAVCFIPPLQRAVFDENAPLRVLKSALEILGAGTRACARPPAARHPVAASHSFRPPHPQAWSRR